MMELYGTKKQTPVCMEVGSVKDWAVVSALGCPQGETQTKHNRLSTPAPSVLWAWAATRSQHREPKAAQRANPQGTALDD